MQEIKKELEVGIKSSVYADLCAGVAIVLEHCNASQDREKSGVE